MTLVKTKIETSVKVLVKLLVKVVVAGIKVYEVTVVDAVLVRETSEIWVTVTLEMLEEVRTITWFSETVLSVVVLVTNVLVRKKVVLVGIKLVLVLILESSVVSVVSYRPSLFVPKKHVEQ